MTTHMNNNPPNPTVTEEMIEAGLQALTFSKNDREQVAAIYLAMKSAAPQEMCDYCATATPGTFNSDMCECNTDLTDVERVASELKRKAIRLYGEGAEQSLEWQAAALLVSNRSGVERPFTYAYRYPTFPPKGATVIRFGTQGREINGAKPIEVIPLYARTALDTEKEK